MPSRISKGYPVQPLISWKLIRNLKFEALYVQVDHEYHWLPLKPSLIVEDNREFGISGTRTKGFHSFWMEDSPRTLYVHHWVSLFTI